MAPLLPVYHRSASNFRFCKCMQRWLASWRVSNVMGLPKLISQVIGCFRVVELAISNTLNNLNYNSTFRYKIVTYNNYHSHKSFKNYRYNNFDKIYEQITLFKDSYSDYYYSRSQQPVPYFRVKA